VPATEHIPVQVIGQIKDFGETRARGQPLVPRSVGALGLHQILDAFVNAATGFITAGE